MRRRGPGAGDPSRYRSSNYDYCQAHCRCASRPRWWGHAVRACTLQRHGGPGGETGDATLLAACEHLWENLTLRRMYLTGGIGPTRANEGFTFDYDLPNETAYAETCAAMASSSGHTVLRSTATRAMPT